MSTSPTFNTVTAKAINLNNPGSMSAAGTVIARDFTATGNIWANNGASRTATFSRVSAAGNVTGANFITLGVVNAVTQIRSGQIIANNSITVVGTTLLNNTGMSTTGNISAAGTVTGGNLVTVGRVSATGNIQGNYILGNGALLTGLAGGVGTYGNSNVAAYLPTYTGTLTSTSLVVGSSTLTNNILNVANIVAAGTIRGSSLSAVGNVIASGSVVASGVIRAGAVTYSALDGSAGQVLTTYGNGRTYWSTVSAGGNVVSTYGNANVAAYLPTYTGTFSPASVNAAGELRGVSLSTSGAITAGGPITGTTLTGTGLSAATTVINNLGINTPSLSASGNVTGGNMRSNGQISATGSITGGNLIVSGIVSAVGTVTGGTFAGNGYALTNILRSSQTRTVYVANTAPAGAVTGDIWYQTV